MPNPSAAAMTPSVKVMRASVMDTNVVLIDTVNRSSIQNAPLLLSKLDLKAPSRARKEYEEGYRALLRNEFSMAVEHLKNATAIYPNYVSALNALGTAYLGLGQSQEARTPFAQAISLDGHLPNSYLNLGCAELVAGDYSGAERDIARAVSMAPTDLNLRTALAYSQYLNKNYDGVLRTTGEVHSQRHDGASLVHLYAAAALEEQGSPSDAEQELRLLLKEDPNSPAAGSAKTLLAQLENEVTHPHILTQVGGEIALTSDIEIRVPADDDGPEKQPYAKELAELADAEAMDEGVGQPILLADASVNEVRKEQGYTFHSSTDEVSIYFAATERGKAVPDLALEDVTLLDGQMRPARVTGFRNEAELPLRIGLVIDCSGSITDRFTFEQEVARNFLQSILTREDDLGFVVAFANSILVAQDFTNDATALARSTSAFVPAGGTAMWDAVMFATRKLTETSPTQPVAKVLVVISDGEDNASVATAKQAIERAQKGEVTVYTINTSYASAVLQPMTVGVKALQTLAEMTGGTAYRPGSARRLNGSLRALNQLIRSRYLITYKPAGFKRDGTYRSINISAQKDGHKLRILARKGYVAGDR